ncbi:hypothetical protein EZS27_028681 [termite gut metagenome]|uniref:Type I restriction modification DNA specificity domain-containing protein n=1 Tax=termite gut metagenome TaxID=433724 RepID=A0A5J4QKA5_9ZZZZ
MIESCVKNIELIGQRFDPYYYNPKFEVIEHKLSKLKYSTIGKECIKIFSGITPKSGGDDYTNQFEGIPFIRSGDFIEDNQLDFNGLNYIKTDVHNKLMKGSQLKQFDVLIAIVGATIGKVGVYNYNLEANINQAICAVRFKDHINPFFVQLFLLTNLGQTIIDRLKRPVARANINLEEIASIPIPFLTIETQKAIVDFYNYAIKTKQAKEQEAKTLLDGIDDYLLKELGIELSENTGNEKYFEVNVSELVGERLDPFYHRIEFTNLFEKIRKKSSIKLRDYIMSINYGASVSNDYVEEGIPFLRIKDLLPNEIQNDDIVFLPYEMKDQLKTSFVSENDFLITRSGTIGIAAIVNNEFDSYAFGSFMIRFSTKHINREFLSYYINSTIGQIYFGRNKIGAIQGNITIPTIKDLPIPDISKEKQDEIAEHIQSIKAKAKQLQKEAEEILEKIKMEVERIIEGKSR